MNFDLDTYEEELQRGAIEFARASLGGSRIHADRAEVFDRAGWQACANFGVLALRRRRVVVQNQSGHLSDNDTASNAVTRIASRIAFQVVRVGVDHQRRTTIGEDGIAALPEGDL